GSWQAARSFSLISLSALRDNCFDDALHSRINSIQKWRSGIMASQQFAGERIDVDLLVVPETNLILVASVIEPLRVANRLIGLDLYGWRIFSPDGKPVETR